MNTACTQPSATTTLRPRAAGTLPTVALLILSIGTFTLGVDGFVLSGLLPQVARSLHVSVSTAGQLTTLFALVYALGSPVIAALAGNWDRRVLLATGMVVFIGGVIVQASGSSFTAVAAGRVLAALGAAAYQATAYSTAGILSDGEHRPRALAIVAGGSSVALVAGLPFGILVGQTWGWRTALWILVALATLSAAAIGLLPPAHAPRLSLRQRGRALTDRRVLGILTGTVTILTPGFLVIAYLPALMHTSGAWIVAAMLAYGVGQVTGTALVPRLIRWHSARRTLLLGACGVTIVTATLTLTRTSPGAATATMTALGLAVGLTVVPQQHRLFTTVPTLAPIAIGLNGSAIYIASALGAAIGGIALATGGHTAPTITAAVIGTLGLTIAITIVPERQRTPSTRRG
ncbi:MULTISPECIES: MFS transporter [unclassified Streptomyces]|uniref:MFS transporter n=1 Tax=unclassified Streptomyces TaxID=2593676 RepID=UPI0040410EB3